MASGGTDGHILLYELRLGVRRANDTFMEKTTHQKNYLLDRDVWESCSAEYSCHSETQLTVALLALERCDRFWILVSWVGALLGIQLSSLLGIPHSAPFET